MFKILKRNRAQTLPGVMSGIQPLDDWLGGFRPGQIIRFRAGDFGVGVHALTTCVIREIVKRYRILYYTVQGNSEITEYMLQEYYGPDYEMKMNGKNIFREANKLMPWFGNLKVLQLGSVLDVIAKAEFINPYIIIFEDVVDKAEYYRSLGFKSAEDIQPSDFKKIAESANAPVILAGKICNMCEADLDPIVDVTVSVRNDETKETDSGMSNVLVCKKKNCPDIIKIPITYA